MTTINSKSELTLDELDRLCAQKVMGWKLGNHPGYPNSEILWFHSAECPVIDEPDFRPTRNIAQAWECLEKFPAYVVATYYKHTKNEIVKVHAAKAFKTLGVDTDFIEAETAPLAITKACLSACGVDIA